MKIHWITASAVLAATLGLGLQAAPQADATPKIESLAWMSGDWELGHEKMQIDEHWTHAAGGTMFGTSRTIADGKTVFFEFLRLETRADGIYYVAQPRGGKGTDFKLVKSDDKSATFENLKHDFPKRILYRRESETSLVARIEGDGTEREKPQDFHYRARATK